MKPWLVFLSLLAMALAGCTSDADDPGDDEDAMADGEEEIVQIEAPEWSIGDWWTYEHTFGADFTLVVTEDDGADWIVDTDSANLAFFGDAFGEISYLGQIRKSDLAGSQDKTRVEWTDFPLVHGKTWTTTWDGFQFDMVSHVSDDGQVAHIVASLGGVPINNLVYDASVGWFTSISFGNTETGEEFGRMDLKDSGSGFEGELVRVDSVLAYQGEWQGPSSEDNPAIDASTASDDSDAYLMYSASCGTGSYEFAVGTFQSVPSIAADTGGENQGYTDIGDACPRSVQFSGVIGEDPNNGDQWGLIMNSASEDLDISYRLYWRNFERITV